MDHVSNPNDDSETSGTITVGLAQPIVVDEVFIEHSYALISPNMSSAPQLIQAWGKYNQSQPQLDLQGDIDISDRLLCVPRPPAAR